VTVRYPRDWSRKTATSDLRPHLSTVDTLLLAVQLADAYLAGALGLREEQRRTARVTRVTLHAGAAPQEQLADLPALALPVRTEPAAGGTDLHSTFDVTVGAMRARCTVRHPDVSQRTTTARHASLDDLLGPAVDRYYGDGFRRRGLDVRDVTADLTAMEAQARVRALDGDVARAGLEGAHQPCLSMVDTFVAGLQLAQVLLYGMDGLSRQETSTLWMLNTVLEAGPRPQPADDPVAMRLTVPGRRLLPLRGATWRNVDVAGSLGDLTLRTSVAHELPGTRHEGGTS
jgi:hypothetical protein